jgi:hypothetical protein
MAHNKYHDYDNFNGYNGQAPPTPGTDSNPNWNPSNGYSPNAPQSTALNVPPTDDYSGWNWEEVLNGILGLSLPSRDDITGLRWTATDNNAKTDGGMWQIFGAHWDNATPGIEHRGFYVYLNPSVQDSNGPWDSYYNTPANQLMSAQGGNWFPGVLDPKDFNTAAVALEGVQGFYNTASYTFDNIASGLNSEASQYQGAAGDAFYQIVSNLNTAAQSIYAQMSKGSGGYGGMMGQSGADTANFVVGLWNAMHNWVSTRLDFSPLGAILQALLDGGILAGDGNGNFTLVPTNVQEITNTVFGNLISDDGWVNVETAAKELWLNAISSSLDAVANPLALNLADSYLNTTSVIQALQAPTMAQIAPPNVDDGGLNGAGGDLNSLFNNVGGDLNSLFNDTGGGLNGLFGDTGGGLNGLFGDTGGGLNGLFGDTGGGLNGLFGDTGGGLNGLFGDTGGGLNGLFGDTGGGLNGLFNGTGDSLDGLFNDTGGDLNGLFNGTGGNLNGLFNGTDGGLSGPGASDISTGLGGGFNSPNEISDLNGGLNSDLNGGLNGDLGNFNAGLGGGLNSSGDITGSGNPGLDNSLQSALGDTEAEQDALQNALSLAPGSGPLHNTLETALANSGKAKTAIDDALASGDTPDAASIQTALGDNKAAQTELQKALASVPKTGPLHDELQSALASTRGVSTALHQALTSSGVPAEAGKLVTSAASPGAGLGSLESALGGGKGLTAHLGGGAGLSAGVGGGGFSGGLGGAAGASGSAGLGGAGVGGVGGAGGLSGGGTGAGAGGGASGTGVPASSGTQTTGDGTSAVPFYPPTAGGGMAGAQQGLQERERTTWLAEDEDVWGTEPSVGPGVLGRDLMDFGDDDLDDYSEYSEVTKPQRHSPTRTQTR